MTAQPGGVIAVAGEALVDVVPAPVGGYFELAPGGSPAHVAVGLARLGVPTRLLTRVADDLLGRRLCAPGASVTSSRHGANPPTRAELAWDERGS